MEQPPPSAVTATLPPIPPPSKLRLMCSYGGHIVPRPHDKSLFYAGGETRIVALDRRTTAASFRSICSHLSRAVFQNLPFLLKYQLPNEDIDSLISVVCDEDLVNMLEEYDRISPPARIRLFLFPFNSDSTISALLEHRSDAWFSDAMKSSQKGPMTRNAADSTETGTTSGGDGKLVAESVRLETSSSFGSSCSSVSMANSSVIGKTQPDDKGLTLLERKSRVPSSASLESENSVGSSVTPPKTGAQETVDQVHQGESSQNSTSDISLNVAATRGIEGIVPQYASPMLISPYYQIPVHPNHILFQSNPHYPVYFVPIRPSHPQHHHMTLNPFDANSTSFSSTQLPLHLPIAEPVFHPEFFGTRVSESANQVYSSMSTLAPDQDVSIMQPLEPLISPETLTSAEAVSASPRTESVEDIVFNQIYKTQTSAPVLPSHP